MRFPLRLYPTPPNYDFIKVRGWGFAFTLIATALTLFMLFTKGLNLGIDFTGGIVMEIRTEETADLSKLRSILANPAVGESSLQSIGDSGSEVMIRIQPKGDEAQGKAVEKIKTIINAEYGAPVEFARVDFVGPQVGKEMVQGSILALSLGMFAIMLYLWFRFEWQFGAGGVLALIHDTIMAIGFFAITQIEFNLTSVAAILTIIGYSINDSVVIYDRIRENMRKYKSASLETIINRSTNETLARTFLTGGTVLSALIGLVWFGGATLYGFSAVMIFGVIVGTYSSIYVSAMVLVYFRPRRENESKQPATA
jgi:preprotein translocase subunit SecF